MGKTVVVTGFGPFGPYKENPSSDVVGKLKESGLPLEGVDLVTDLMSVDYGEVTKKVEEYWNTHNPDLIIHVGVHAVNKTVKLEQRSFGLGYCRYDVCERVPPNNCCPTVPQSELVTSIDCRSIAQKVQETTNYKGLWICKSDDPGRYLCGFSYYLSLCHDSTKSLFVHIPPFDEEITVDIITDVLTKIIVEILKTQ